MGQKRNSRAQFLFNLFVVISGLNYSIESQHMFAMHASFKVYEIPNLKYPQDIGCILPISNIFCSKHVVGLHNAEINKMLD